MLSYRIKIRRTTYLWGGAEVSEMGKPSSNLYLHFRVDEAGEPIRFGVRQDSAQVEMGVLGAGECFTIRLDGITGVYATLVDPQDTMVDCAVVNASE